MDFIWIENGSQIPRKVEPMSESDRVFSVKKEKDQTSAQKIKLITPEEQEQYQRSQKNASERRKPLVAKQIMSSPVMTLFPENTLDEAWAFISNYRFRHVPVVDREKKLVGIISDRDLLREAANIGRRAPSESGESFPVITIEGLMKTKVLVARTDTEIPKIARVLFEERIGAMPIVDSENRIEGMITRSDILRTLIQQSPIALWV